MVVDALSGAGARGRGKGQGQRQEGKGGKNPALAPHIARS